MRVRGCPQHLSSQAQCGSHDWPCVSGYARPQPDLPGVFKGPGEGTLKFCGVRAVTGLWEGCGEGLGRKLLGDGAGPELQQRERERVCELRAPAGPPREPGREGHPGQAYLTLELG